MHRKRKIVRAFSANPLTIHLLTHIFISSHRLPSFRMGPVERVRRQVWNWHEITITVNSESARERRQALRFPDTKARLPRLPMQKRSRAKSPEWWVLHHFCFGNTCCRDENIVKMLRNDKLPWRFVAHVWLIEFHSIFSLINLIFTLQQKLRCFCLQNSPKVDVKTTRQT